MTEPQPSVVEVITVPVPLVVVDMQAGFAAANEIAVILGVHRQVQLARRRKARVVFVEHAGHGDTHGFLKWPVRSTCRTVKKRCNSAARHLVQLFSGLGIERGELIRVCGIEADVCVAETVRGLSLEGFRVEIAADACGSHPSSQGKSLKLRQLAAWRSEPGVRVR